VSCAEACVFVVRDEWYRVEKISECEFNPCVATIECVALTTSYEWGVAGRKVTGSASEPPAADKSLIAYLAWTGQMESEAAVAFSELAEFLHQLGAPLELVNRCVYASEDEQRHASTIRALLPHSAPVEIERRATSITLLDIAKHNAVHGCVLETWAAVHAASFAKSAIDEDVRQAHAAVANDEMRHGALSWDVHRWLMTQLCEIEAEEVRELLRATLRGLVRTAPASMASHPKELGVFAEDHATKSAMVLWRELGILA